MPLEPSFDNIDDLDPLNPFGSDPKSEGAPHLRGIKSSLVANVTGSALETRLLVAAIAQVIASDALLRLIRPDPGAYTLQGEDSGGIAGAIEFDPVTGVNMLEAGGVKVLTDILAELRILNPTAGVGLAFEMEATTGKGTIRETDGVGAPGNAWLVLTPAGGVAMLFADVVRVESTATGGLTTGQHKVSEAVPVDAEDLTRKDYVDNLVAGLQADIDGIKNGFAFTGAISAPGVTEV